MISVIIPAYNAERYIDDCLRSVLTQEDADFEAVVVNDGSEDWTGERCRQWASRYGNITYMEQENQGQGSARNHGIRHASGDWLVFLDADDELVPGALHKLQEMAAGSPDIVCYEFFLRRHGACQEDEHIRISEGEYRWNGDLVRESTSFLWDKMFRAEFWEEKALSLDDAYGEDFKAVYLLEALCGSFALLREPLIRHYEREDNLSCNPGRVMEITGTIEETLKEFHDRELLERYRLSLFYIVYRQYKLYQSPDFCPFEPEQVAKVHRELQHILGIYFEEYLDWLAILQKTELVAIGYRCRVWYGDTEMVKRFAFFPELESFIVSDRENVAEHLLCIVDLSQEGRCSRFATRSDAWQERRWEELAGEFIRAVYKRGKNVLICILNKADTQNQKLYEMLVNHEGIYGILENTPVLELLITEKLCFGKGKEDSFTEQEMANSAGTFWCKGEQYRLQFNENILNAWLMLRNRGWRLEVYFIERQYRKVAVYGMGYLGDRLLEELADSEVDVMYGIDRKRVSGKAVPIYSMEDSLPEADAIIVAVPHLFFEIKYDLQRKTDIPVVSLEEVLEALADCHGSC